MNLFGGNIGRSSRTHGRPIHTAKSEGKKKGRVKQHAGRKNLAASDGQVHVRKKSGKTLMEYMIKDAKKDPHQCYVLGHALENGMLAKNERPSEFREVSREDDIKLAVQAYARGSEGALESDNYSPHCCMALAEVVLGDDNEAFLPENLQGMSKEERIATADELYEKAATHKDWTSKMLFERGQFIEEYGPKGDDSVDDRNAFIMYQRAADDVDGVRYYSSEDHVGKPLPEACFKVAEYMMEGRGLPLDLEKMTNSSQMNRAKEFVEKGLELLEVQGKPVPREYQELVATFGF